MADNIDNDIRELLHIAVKKNADDWWHEFPDMWIVGSSHGPLWWQDRLAILFGKTGSVLILALPGTSGERDVGYLLRTPRGSSRWFKDVYSETVILDEEPIDFEPPPEDDEPSPDDYEPPF